MDFEVISKYLTAEVVGLNKVTQVKSIEQEV